VSWFLPEMTTRAPARASSSAPARPIPEPPPVTQAVLPFRESVPGILRGSEEVLLLLLRHLALAARVLQHVERALHRRTREERIAPALERRVLVDVHALPVGEAQPRHGRHVGDGVLVAGEILRFLQLPLHYAVEAVRLVPVAVHGVLDFLRRVAQEMEYAMNRYRNEANR